MNAKISELEIRKDLKIREGSIVSLDFDGDGRTIEVEIFEIFMRDGEVLIESSTRNFGCFMTHDEEQYRESAKLIKF